MVRRLAGSAVTWRIAQNRARLQAPRPAQAAGTASGTRSVDAWPVGPEIVDATDYSVVGLLLAAAELGVALVGVRGS